MAASITAYGAWSLMEAYFGLLEISIAGNAWLPPMTETAAIRQSQVGRALPALAAFALTPSPHQLDLGVERVQATRLILDGTSGEFMRIDRITLSNTISVFAGGLEQDILAVVEPGKSYYVSARARSSSSGAVQLEMRETTGSGQETDLTIGRVAANDNEFLLIEGDYTVPDDLLGLPLIAQGTDFSLDHVQVYEYQTPNIWASVLIDDGDGAISIG